MGTMKRCLLCSLALALLLGALPCRAVGPRFTLMIYMCAADLETRDRAATRDLRELVDAGITENGLTVLVATGAANVWHTPGIDAGSNQYFLADQNGLTLIKDVGARDMCDAGTLRDFVAFAVHYAPAERMALVMWDHGDGPVNGFGYDERYRGPGMGLHEMALALEAGLNGQKLAFIGFDACLMSAAECAGALSPVADVMIASQELEPGRGWNYTGFAGTLNQNPDCDIAKLGKEIAGDFVRDAFRASRGSAASLAVIDLGKIDGVAAALSDLGGALDARMEAGALSAVARARASISSFGEADGEASDLIDAGQLSSAFSRIAPAEAEKLIAAVKACVLYKKNSPLTPGLSGLSVFFPYATLNNSKVFLPVLEKNQAFSGFTGFLRAFSEEMTSGQYELGLDAPQKASAGGGVLDILGQLADAFASANDAPTAPAPTPYADMWEGLFEERPASGGGMWAGLPEIAP